MPGQKKILVADDSLTIQKVIRLALSQEDYEIEAVSDGKEAIERIALFRPDLCLIDVSLPRKNAFAVKREISSVEDFNQLKFILMSSAFEQVDEDQVKTLEFHGRLVKPFDPAHLRKTLAQVFAVDSAEFSKKSKTEVSLGNSLFDLSEKPSNDDLWMTQEEVKTNSAIEPPPPFEEQPVVLDEPEDDIKKLTESTLRMSGLDESGWSVNEGFSSEPAREPSYRDSSRSAFDGMSGMGMRSGGGSSGSSASVDPAFIRSEVERVVKELFPKLAEKVIREEIHKLLENPPQN